MNFHNCHQAILRGVKIKGDRFKEEGAYLEIDLEEANYEECQTICKSLSPQCGAWSFDTVNLKCFIHTVNSCCGQFGKREEVTEWISGYSCEKCWSTKRNTDCPCSLKERLQVIFIFSPCSIVSIN